MSNWIHPEIGLKLQHLRLVAAMAGTGQISAAAAQIGVSQPAASRLLAEVELLIGQPVHLRQGRGMVLTAQGAALARRAARVLIELSDMTRELAEIGAGTGGHVRIGAITGAALDRVLPVLQLAQAALPDITVTVEVGASEQLAEMILQGRIDFALCRLPASRDPAGFSFDPLGDEQVDLVVRRDHPLLSHPGLTPSDLLRHDWVLPGPDAVLRQAVLARLTELGLPAPPGRLTTSSFLLTLAMLGQSDAIAPLSRPVAQRFATAMDAPFATLPLDLGIRMAVFGLLMRQDIGLTPAAGRIKALIAGA